MFKEGPAPTTTKDLTLLGRTGHHLDLNELSELFVNGTELSKSVAWFGIIVTVRVKQALKVECEQKPELL